VGIVMVVTAMLMNIALTTFYNQLLQAFLWIWMGLGVRSAKTISDSGTAQVTGITSSSIPSPIHKLKPYTIKVKIPSLVSRFQVSAFFVCETCVVGKKQDLWVNIR
jgi:hypothetical protein